MRISTVMESKPTLRLVTAAGRPVSLGDTLETFRGERCVLEDVVAPRHEGSTGRVCLRFEDGATALYFPGVCGLVWEEVR